MASIEQTAADPAAPANGSDSARLRVAVIVGSTRKGRAADIVAKWFVSHAQQRQDLDLDMVDLVDFEFPAHHPEEPTPAMTAFTSRIDAADAFVVVTPEYNHSYPASLKQAVDYGYDEWNAKPVGFVSYGGSAQGQRAVEHLRLVFAELHAVTIRDCVCLVSPQFTGGAEDGSWLFDPDASAQAVTTMLDRLAWWAYALRRARATRPYPS